MAKLGIVRFILGLNPVPADHGDLIERVRQCYPVISERDLQSSFEYARRQIGKADAELDERAAAHPETTAARRARYAALLAVMTAGPCAAKRRGR